MNCLVPNVGFLKEVKMFVHSWYFGYWSRRAWSVQQVRPLASPRDMCKFLPISFILFHLLRIMFTYNNTVRIYWEILGAVINVISFACRGGFYCVALHWHPIRAFYYLSSFVFKLNTFSLFFFPLSSKWLFAWRFAFKWMWREHWQHLANLVKAAQYLSLQTWMGKKNSMNVL